MQFSRKDNKKVVRAVTAATAKLQEAVSILEPVLELLSPDQRENIARVRNSFPAAARQLAAAAPNHPEMVAAVDYDAEAVIEDLDNVDALKPLDAPLGRINQMVADSRLHWQAEAYVPSLELYGVAKVRARRDGDLAQTIKPMAEAFATLRKGGGGGGGDGGAGGAGGAE
jgi:hypothetical protein